MKNNKGITLIVLIITVIIMLILVGVIIDIAIEDDGLINNAKNAVDQTNDKVGKTQSRVDELMEILEDTKTAQDLGGNVSNVVAGVPIPKGFYYVGGSKNTGVVISDSSSDANKGVDANLVGNQFVWVPVEPNQVITIESEEDITNIAATDPCGATVTANRKDSKTYEIIPTLNGLYTIEITTARGTTTETRDIHSLYEQDFWEEYYKEDSIWNAIMGMAEWGNPEEVWDELDGSALYPDIRILEDESINVFEILGDFYEIAAKTFSLNRSRYVDSDIARRKSSVNKYGGFYIARYEAGNDGGNVVFKKNKTPYGNISQQTAENLSKNMYLTGSVTSCLTNAAAWNRTLNWLIETEAISKSDMMVDSTDWGNYIIIDDNDCVWSIDMINTGAEDYTKKNNIYDLAGNLAEWTTEILESDAVMFGGSCCSVGEFGVSNRPKAPINKTNPYVGFRTTLYINL